MADIIRQVIVCHGDSGIGQPMWSHLALICPFSSQLPAGTSLQAQQDSAGAAAHYKEAMMACPSYAAAHYNLGVLQTSQGQASRHHPAGMPVALHYRLLVA